MDTLNIENQAVTWSYNEGKLNIEAWGTSSLRVRWVPYGELDLAQDWALLPQTPATPQFVRKDNEITIINGKIKATVDLQGRVVIRNERDEVLLEELWRQRDVEVKFWSIGVKDQKCISALKISGREAKPLVGGASEMFLRFESNPQEKLYGMGQYQQSHLDLKGCTVELAQRNSQASVPFVVSSLGYGFLWNNPAVGEVHFSKNETCWHAKATRQMDYWVTAGDTPAEILAHYADATGKPPMMPEYAMGLWQCKLRYRTQDELLNVAREYKKRNIPLSVIVVDYFHWPNQGEWCFDSREWPNPKAMVDELKEMGVELMVSFWPTVDSRASTYAYMHEKGYLVNTNKGLNINLDFLGNTRYLDATHPGARNFVWQKAKENYYKLGIQLFWLDEAEPEFAAYDYEHFRYHLGQTQEVGNIYPAMFAKAFYDGLKAEGKTEIVNLLRCAWAGSQRYGALVWSGDIHSSFDCMRNQLSAGLNMGMAGIPWWTTDIGGFHGGDIRDPKFHELLVRWFQWAVFSPVLRMHGHRDPIIEPEEPYRDGIAVCNTGSPNELWSYGEQVYDILKRYTELRLRLKPYLKKILQHTHETGAPVMRPLFYDFPQQKTCWEVEDQYMFGPDILVAPILHPGQVSREVYLPEGVSWVNIWDQQSYQGGKRITVTASLAEIPVFVRKEAEVLGVLQQELARK